MQAAATTTDTVQRHAKADPLKRLPPAARAKLEHLRRMEQRSRALVDALQDQREEVRQRRDQATRELAAFDRANRPQSQRVEDAQTGKVKQVSVEYPERAELLAQIEEAKTELARLAADQQEAILGINVADLTVWAQQDRGRLIDVPPAKLSRGSSLTEALDANRAEQSALADQLEAVRNAPLSTSEAKSKMRAEVAALAERGKPMVDGLFHDGGVEWPQMQVVATGAGVHEYIVSTFIPDALAVAVWANQAAIIKSLESEIDHTSGGRTALTAEARASKIAECEAALLEAQRRGEAVVARIETEGRIVRRVCVDPFVLLGLARQDA